MSNELYLNLIKRAIAADPRFVTYLNKFSEYSIQNPEIGYDKLKVESDRIWEEVTNETIS